MARGLKKLLISWAVLVITLVGCPLPFEFTPSNSTAGSGSIGDPANPSITAAPVLVVNEVTSGQRIDSTSTTIVSPRDVTIGFSSDTRGARFFYTIDGSNPVPGQPATRRYPDDGPAVYAGDGAGGTIKSIAIAPSMYPSVVTTRTVTVDYLTVAAPVFSPPPGNYQNDQTITIASSTPGTTIWYRIVDGTGGAPTPIPGDGLAVEYTAPITIAGHATAKSIAAIAVRSEMRDSAVANALYTIGYGEQTQAPVFSLRNGYQGVGTQLSMVTSTDGATIYYTYTDDGSLPSTPVPGGGNTFAYTGPITLTGLDTQHRFVAIAVAPARMDSDPVSATFTTVPRILVTSASDGFQGYTPTTLRIALLAVNSPGQEFGDAFVPAGTTVSVIEFAQSLGNSFTIQLNPHSEPLPVTRSVVISGDPHNPGRVTISGGNATRIFGVTGGDVTIRDVTLEAGRAQAHDGIGGAPDSSGGGGGGGVGGAIYVRGSTTSLTIVNSILRQNSAIGGAGGAGGQVNAGQFFASGSDGGDGIGVGGFPTGGGAGGVATGFDTGSPGGNGGWLGGGGAGASLSSNPRVGGDGGFAGGGGGGGARRSGDNGALGGAGGAFGGAGGRGNSSGTAGGGGGAGLGGAIFVESGALILIDTEFVANTAVGGSGGSSLFGPPHGQPGQGRGGAVFLHTGTTSFSADNVVFTNNAVASGGGPPLPEDVYDSR